jgi:site-specific recombinase XerD
LILVAYRHGLRASEIADLEWSQVEFGHAARAPRQERQAGRASAARRRGPRPARVASAISRLGLCLRHRARRPVHADAINRLVNRIGARAGRTFPVHAHLLRHACGYAPANAGHDTRRIQDWLGNRSIQHTTRYTKLSAALFKDLWRQGGFKKLNAESSAKGADCPLRTR